jgi:hypothetical protein
MNGETIQITGLQLEGEYPFARNGFHGTVTGPPEPPPRPRPEHVPENVLEDTSVADDAAPVPLPPAENAAPRPADPLFLPDGTPLLLTLSRKIWLCRLFGRDEDDAWAGPDRPHEDQAVLFMAANPPAVWLAPGREDDGQVRPLVHRPRALQEAMDLWTDEKLSDFSIAELKDLAAALWDGEHATQIVVLSKKKEARMTAAAASRLTGASNT